ncbi:MAG: hypothetical protein IPG87_01970 [Saprospiraceae bacterium]|nr:hypothetical protein [Candidatus Vicinibacter affinis]
MAKDWDHISLTNRHVLALKFDGTLWAWGDNAGKLGNGDIQSVQIATKIGTSNDWKSIEAGENNSIGIKKMERSGYGATMITVKSEMEH